MLRSLLTTVPSTSHRQKLGGRLAAHHGATRGACAGQGTTLQMRKVGLFWSSRSQCGVETRLYYVSSRTTDQDPNNQRLREEYRGAFNEWALQVSRLRQTEGNSPDRVIDEAAAGRAAAAEIAYRQTRDRLTDGMRIDAPKAEGRP